MKAQLAQQSIRRLKPGEKLKLRGGQTLEVKDEEMGPDRALLLPEWAPVPTPLEKIKGHWKVDASLIISGRRAADEARRKAEAKKAGQGK